MSEIIRPAYFEISEDASHGQIVFSDGTREEGVESKMEAFIQLISLVKLKKILDVEALFLLEQINNSTLPELTPPELEEVAEMIYFSPYITSLN